MKSERLPVVLQILLGIIVLLVLLAMVRGGTPSMDAAVYTLQTGDATESERQRALEAVLHHAEHGKKRGALRMAWSAALALGDSVAAATVGRRLNGEPLRAGEKLDVARLSLGEPPLRALYEGLLAEVAGDAEAARAAYLRAEHSARMFALPLVAAEAASRRSGL